MVGTGALNPVISGVALGSVPPAQSGLAAGINDMFRQAGIAIGIAAYGAIAPVDLAFDPATHGKYVEYLYDALWVGATVALLCGLVAGHLVARASAAGERSPSTNEIPPDGSSSSTSARSSITRWRAPFEHHGAR